VFCLQNRKCTGGKSRAKTSRAFGSTLVGKKFGPVTKGAEKFLEGMKLKETGGVFEGSHTKERSAVQKKSYPFTIKKELKG